MSLGGAYCEEHGGLLSFAYTLSPATKVQGCTPKTCRSKHDPDKHGRKMSESSLNQSQQMPSVVKTIVSRLVVAVAHWLFLRMIPQDPSTSICWMVVLLSLQQVVDNTTAKTTMANSDNNQHPICNRATAPALHVCQEQCFPVAKSL